MVVATGRTWRDLKAEMVRADVTATEVAPLIPSSYSRFATLIASEGDSLPTPDYAERVLAAIKRAADKKAGVS